MKTFCGISLSFDLLTYDNAGSCPIICQVTSVLTTRVRTEESVST